jgi:hypothetical protein
MGVTLPQTHRPQHSSKCTRSTLVLPQRIGYICRHWYRFFSNRPPTVTCPERSVSRESVAAAKRKATAHASITPCCAHRNMEVPMPVVRNGKSRAMDFCDGGRRGRGRHAKSTACSRFVLAGLSAALATWIGIVDVRVKISLVSALPTVNGPERSVSRESVAAAKRKATAHASITPCCA